MADKTPVQITAGNANDDSVVHASDADVSDLSRSHKERDISRLQSSSLAYSPSKTYAIGDLVTFNNFVYRNITAIGTPESFDNTKWQGVDSQPTNLVKTREWNIEDTGEAPTFFLGSIRVSSSSDGGITGVIYFDHLPAPSSGTPNLHFMFSQRLGVQTGQWWFEHTDQPVASNRVYIELIDVGDAGTDYEVWVTGLNGANAFIKGIIREGGNWVDNGTLSVTTKSAGTALFDTRNTATSEHVIGILNSTKTIVRDIIEFGDKTTQVAGHNEGFGGNISTLILKQTELLPDSRNPTGLCIRPNGRRVFIGDDVTNFIFEYNMPTAWDVSSLSAQIASFDVGTAVSATVDLRDIHFRQDGLKMYAVDTNLNRVYEFDLSTDWDISTASYDGKFIAVGAQDGNPFGLFFKPDGTRMYHTGNATDDIFQYDLSIPWDISTAIYNGIFQDLSTQDTAPHSITFSPDGTILYMAGTTTDTIFQYNLAIPWDLAVLTVTTNTFDYSAFDSSIRGLVFKPDFTKAIAAGITNDSLYELDMGLTIEGNILKNGNVGGVSRTGSTTFEIYSESDLPDPVTGVITLPTGVYLFQQGMTLSNQLEIAAGATVELKAPSGSVFAITYLGTASPFISAPDTGSTITTTNIQLVTVGANMVFINSDAENTRFNDTQMIMTGTGTQKIGTFNNSAAAFTVRDTLFLAKDGLTFTTIDNIQLDGAFGFFTDTSTTTIYDVQALTTGANFDRCRNILDANKTLFDIASSITSPLIVVNFCRSNLATFYDATGLDQTDVNLRAIGNDSPDSMSTGEVSTEDIATPITVTIASQDTPVVIAGGGWASTNLEEFTADSNGILTYIGLSTKQINVAYYALFEKVGGGATDIELTLLRNGSEIAANAPRSVNAGIIQISGTDIISLATDDTLQLAVTNRSGTANIDVSQANLVGSRG